MARADQPVAVTFERGLLDQQEASVLPNGFATLLDNWVPEPTGGLRVRPKWLQASTTGWAGGTVRGLGIGYIASPTKRIVVASESTVGTTVSLYYLPVSNLAAGTWTTLENVSVGSNAAQPVSFALGLGNLFYTHPQFTAIRRWDGTAAAAAVTGSPAGARCVAFHKERVFAGATTTKPTRLHYSDVGDGTTWDLTEGTGQYINVGEEDGEPIESLAIHLDGLLIGKANSIWLLTGAGPDTFQLRRIDGDAGVAPGHTLVASPDGVFIIGERDVWLWDGGPPILLSAPVQGFEMTGPVGAPFVWATATARQGVCYISDRNTGWAYDFGAQSWWNESTHDAPANPGAYATFAGQLYMVPGSNSQGNYVALQYRRDVRGNDLVTKGRYQAATPEMWLAGSVNPVVPRELWLRIRQRSGGGNDFQYGLDVTIEYGQLSGDVITETHQISPHDASGVWTERLTLSGKEAHRVKLTFANEWEPSTTGVAFDIEQVSLSYDTEDWR